MSIYNFKIAKGGGFICVLLSLFFISCSSKKDEEIFKNRVNTLIESSDSIETDFVDLTDFEWDKVCFKDASTVKLEFINSKTNQKTSLDLSNSKFIINEDYVKGSPAKLCFSRSQVFIIKMSYGHKYYIISVKEGN